MAQTEIHSLCVRNRAVSDLHFSNLKNNSVRLPIDALLDCLYEHCSLQGSKAFLTHHTINVYTGLGVSNLWPASQVGPTACFHRWSYWHTATWNHLCISYGCFTLQQQGWDVATEIVWTTKPKERYLLSGALQKKFANSCTRTLGLY